MTIFSSVSKSGIKYFVLYFAKKGDISVWAIAVSSSIISAVIVLLCGVVFLYQAFLLHKECTIPAAKKLMFGSFFYLPIVHK